MEDIHMITNNASDRGEHIKDLRDAIEHRATWFYYMLKEAQKRGLDYDFARDAIKSVSYTHLPHLPVLSHGYFPICPLCPILPLYEAPVSRYRCIKMVQNVCRKRTETSTLFTDIDK